MIKENNFKYVCVTNYEEYSELAGNCFRVTGENETLYFLESHELVYSVNKNDCKEAGESSSPIES